MIYPHEIGYSVDAMAEFIDKMRGAAPFGKVAWNEQVWDVSDVLTRAGKRRHIATRSALCFVQHRTPGVLPVGFSAEFDEFAKATICAQHLRGSQVAGVHRVTLRALRYLHDALAARDTMNPRGLELRDFKFAESSILNREKASSAYRAGQRLEEISKIIDVNRLTPIEIRYRSAIPRSTRTAERSKMPASDILEALGDISSGSLADRASDLILMRVVDLLVASGLRVGEVLTLPLDPIVNDAEGFGLRYWPEKGAETRIKRFASAQRELVERAVNDLTSVCAAARDLARWYGTNPLEVPLPIGVASRVRPSDIVEIGLAKDGNAWLRTHGVHLGSDGSCSRRDVETALVRMRDDRPLVRTGDGRTQHLGDSLIVIFLNEMHATRPTNRFVPDTLKLGALADFLGARTSFGKESIFDRYQRYDARGAAFQITTHQFRHWLHTIAARGGLSEVELARWMGRRRIADNRAYDHRTHEERVEEARELIRAGRATGAVATAYRSLPPADGESFLQAQINAVLTTPYGMCVHDYGQAPCERHFSCAGCAELVRTTGDERERAAIRKSLDETRVSLASAASEVSDGSYGASNWMAYQQRLEIDLIALLAVDDESDVVSGLKIRPRPNGHGAVPHEHV